MYRRVINQFPGRIESPTDQRCVEELDRFLFQQIPSGLGQRVRGFKLKYPSQSKLFPEIALKLVDSATDINLVVLHRRDYLRRAISVLNLQRIQTVTSKANVNHPVDLPATAFDPVEVARLAKYYQSNQNEFEAWAAPFGNCLHLDYKDLQDKRQAKLSELQEFLGIPIQHPLTSTTHKITPDDLGIHVTNLREICAELKRQGIRYDKVGE